MKLFIQRYIRAENGVTAAEFAMVLPLLILFLFGIIDIGRFMWTWNMGEKATQMGVRYAIVTNTVPSGLKTFDFAALPSTDPNYVPQGQVVPSTVFGGATCTSTTCSCTGTFPAASCTADLSAFTGILTRIRTIMPIVAPENLRVDYLYSGLGYSGDPFAPNVLPLVRVQLIPGGNPLTFQPILGAVFGFTINLPDFSATLPLEDGSGTNSN
jgi:Flp pilus assembly protein TadG